MHVQTSRLKIVAAVFTRLLNSRPPSENPKGAELKPKTAKDMPNPSLFEDTQRLWYFEDTDHEQLGPVTFAALHSFLIMGIISLDTLVLPNDGENRWRPCLTIFIGEESP